MSTYYVHAVGPLRDGLLRAVETWGPYGLEAAKDFARIGSQTGKHARTVTRGRAGLLIRIYRRGKRTFPSEYRDLSSMTAAERPRTL